MYADGDREGFFLADETLYTHEDFQEMIRDGVLEEDMDVMDRCEEDLQNDHIILSIFYGDTKELSPIQRVLFVSMELFAAWVLNGMFYGTDQSNAYSETLWSTIAGVIVCLPIGQLEGVWSISGKKIRISGDAIDYEEDQDICDILTIVERLRYLGCPPRLRPKPHEEDYVERVMQDVDE